MAEYTPKDAAGDITAFLMYERNMELEAVAEALAIALGCLLAVEGGGLDSMDKVIADNYRQAEKDMIAWSTQH